MRIMLCNTVLTEVYQWVRWTFFSEGKDVLGGCLVYDWLVPIIFRNALATYCYTCRTDKRFKKFTGYLCGLGLDAARGGPALPDHDMEVAFDTLFTTQDLIDVCNRVILFTILFTSYFTTQRISALFY